ncbi:MAG: YjbQ family protein [Cytophagales bacterium]|nr:YjbQ family protein [Armatimonadota bacterium]
MQNQVQELTLRTARRSQLIEITREVAEAVARSGVRSGLCVVYVPHTTAAVCINENADPDVRADVERFVDLLIPEGAKPVLNQFEHSEGNSDSHIKSILTGPSVTLMIENGRPLLGRWQGIYFAEFDGPRTRNTWVKTLADTGV